MAMIFTQKKDILYWYWANSDIYGIANTLNIDEQLQDLYINGR